MTTIYDMRQDQGSPSIPLDYYTRDGLAEFATGWTFEGRIAHFLTPEIVLAIMPTERFTGADASPNLLVDFQAEDLAGLTPARWGTVYVVHIYATPSGGDENHAIAYDPKDPLHIRVLPTPAVAALS